MPGTDTYIDELTYENAALKIQITRMKDAARVEREVMSKRKKRNFVIIVAMYIAVIVGISVFAAYFPEQNSALCLGIIIGCFTGVTAHRLLLEDKP